MLRSACVKVTALDIVMPPIRRESLLSTQGIQLAPFVTRELPEAKLGPLEVSKVLVSSHITGVACFCG